MLQVIENHLLSIVTKAFKSCKDSCFCKDFLNTYLHTSILHHVLFSIKLFFQLSNKVFLKYFENILA
jgi:hypothetical protein